MRTLRQVQTEQSQQMKVSNTDIQTKGKEVESQIKKLESEKNITYIMDNIKRNGRKDSIEKYWEKKSA